LSLFGCYENRGKGKKVSEKTCLLDHFYNFFFLFKSFSFWAIFFPLKSLSNDFLPEIGVPPSSSEKEKTHPMLCTTYLIWEYIFKFENWRMTLEPKILINVFEGFIRASFSAFVNILTLATKTFEEFGQGMDS
jgi:hypothetical protein